MDPVCQLCLGSLNAPCCPERRRDGAQSGLIGFLLALPSAVLHTSLCPVQVAFRQCVYRELGLQLVAPLAQASRAPLTPPVRRARTRCAGDAPDTGALPRLLPPLAAACSGPGRACCAAAAVPPPGGLEPSHLTRSPQTPSCAVSLSCLDVPGGHWQMAPVSPRRSTQTSRWCTRLGRRVRMLRERASRRSAGGQPSTRFFGGGLTGGAIPCVWAVLRGLLPSTVVGAGPCSVQTRCS
jgi:hypothetical protein